MKFDPQSGIPYWIQCIDANVPGTSKILLSANNSEDSAQVLLPKKYAQSYVILRGISSTRKVDGK